MKARSELSGYKQKRDFRLTPEPEGKVKKSEGSRLYIIQKHDASRLHYDFRLELGGVLKSWAVPKGPSLDPNDKRLAVQVEDHPVAYGSFEGIIPEGRYGGGTVMLWDRGDWEAIGDPKEGIRKGKLEFRLNGEKLKGEWALVRMSGRGREEGKDWLLIKKKDKYARSGKTFDVLNKYPASVATGRGMNEIAGARDRVWRSPGKKSKRASSAKENTSRKAAESTDMPDPAELPDARKARLPQEVSPQLATLVGSPPEGNGWLHELKFDGYRIISILENKKAKLLTRNGKDWTKKFGNIARALEELPVNQAVLDGEVVVLNPDGVSDFQALQNALRESRKGVLHYFLFDLIYCNGYDLTRTPLIDRKRLLKTIFDSSAGSGSLLRFSDHIVGSGDSVYKNACGMSLEGIVSKRVDAAYVERRTRDWVKVKCIKRQEFVIGGYKESSKSSRAGFRSLLLGYYEDRDTLVYCGGVGTGFNQASLREIGKRLGTIRQKNPPFKNPPTGSDARGVHWVQPKLAAEVEFTEWTDENMLRHPSFKGIREDKPAKEIIRERGAAGGPMKKDQNNKKNTGDDIIAGIHLTHGDRILYPDQGLTKIELARFYEDIADWILPHIVNRPLTVVRCPGGSQQQCFYQKNIGEGLPAAIHGVIIGEKKEDKSYIAIKDLKGLISLVQIGVLEIHPWGSRTDKLEKPDRMVFDLDPGEGVSYVNVVDAAFALRDRLGKLGLESFVKTSGGKGLHVVVRLERRSGWEEIKTFSKAVADEMVSSEPDKYIATMSKAKRKGKIFIDYLRNNRDATAVAAYSTRARKGAPVSTPIGWDELTPELTPYKYNVENLRERLSALKQDPWEDFFNVRQKITASMRTQIGV